MTPETKEKLIQYNKQKGYEISDDSIIETILYCGTTVCEGKQERHRWYSLIPTVILIGDIYIQFDFCDVHGEMGSVEDCIGGYKLDMFTEVVPVEVKTIQYKPIQRN